MTETPIQSQAAGTLRGITYVAALLIGCLVGYAAHTWTHESVKDQLAIHQVNEARADASTEEAGRRRLQAAVDRGNRLESQLAASETRYRQLAQEQRNAVKSHTTGRVCLDAGAVRVLNAGASAPGDAPDGLPGADVDAAAAGTAAAADSGIQEAGAAATDVDIANWAITVKEQYGVCRDRLQRLIDWFAPATSDSHTTDTPHHD